MEHDLRVWATAMLLLERYGQRAPDVAQQWSRELVERHELEAAATCLKIVDAAKEMLAAKETPSATKAKRGRKAKRRRRPDHAA
jgi:hypothetical protein